MTSEKIDLEKMQNICVEILDILRKHKVTALEEWFILGLSLRMSTESQGYFVNKTLEILKKANVKLE